MKEIIIFIFGLVVGAGLVLALEKSDETSLSLLNKKRAEQKEKTYKKF